MRLKKSDLLPALEVAGRLGSARTTHGWLRGTHLTALGLGEEVEVAAWGADGSFSVVIPGDADPGERVGAGSKALLDVVARAIGDDLSIVGVPAEDRPVNVTSTGRSGLVDPLPCDQAPLPPRRTKTDVKPVILTPACGEALARALKLCARTVANEDVLPQHKHVTVTIEDRVCVVATDGRVLCYFAADTVEEVSAAALMSESISVTPDVAEVLSDVVLRYGPALAVEQSDAALVVCAGRARLNALCVTTAKSIKPAVVRDHLVKMRGAGRVTTNLRSLLEAVRYATERGAGKCVPVRLMFGEDGMTVASDGWAGSTRIDAKTRTPGGSSFNGARLARTLASADTEERGTAALFIDPEGKLPLQLVATGEGWERRHMVAPLLPTGTEE